MKEEVNNMNKERKIVTMRDEYENETYIVLLTSDQINLLNYLRKHNLLTNDMSWTINDEIEEI